MSWFKESQMQHPKSFEDRNLINEKIRYFELVRDKFESLAKIVFQDGYFAKTASMAFAEDKKMSSHPKMRDLLLKAESIALDNPWKFSELCFDVSDEADRQIAKLTKLRKELINETLPNRMRGWVD